MTERVRVLNKLTRQNASLVLAIGFTYGEALVAAAAAHPRTDFAIIDSVPEPLAANSQGVVFASNEGSFLVGAAAALKSTSSKIGFLGAMDIPVIEEFRAGFVAGVAYINPAATVEVAYVSTDYGGFSDPDKAYAMALDMYARGIDIIYPAGGGSTIGVTWAARDYSAAAGHDKVWMIGVDSDFYPEVDDSLKPFVLTSMVKRVDVAAYETVKAQVTDTFVGGGVEMFDLAREGVNYTTSGGFIDDIVGTLEAIRAGIIDGTISVP